MSSTEVYLSTAFGAVYLHGRRQALSDNIFAYLYEGKLQLIRRDPGQWTAQLGFAEDPDYPGYVRVHQNQGTLFAGVWPAGPRRIVVYAVRQHAPCLWWEPAPQPFGGAILCFLPATGSSFGLLELNKHGIHLWDYVSPRNVSILEACFHIQEGRLVVERAR